MNSILTISRINRLLKRHGIVVNPAETDNPALSLILLQNENSQVIDDLIELLQLESFDELLSVFIDIQVNVLQYVDEINNRKDFAINTLSTWKEDETQIQEEISYPGGDYYLSCHKVLAEHGINSLDVTIYEALLLSEEIQCSEIIKSIHEMIGIIQDKNKTFCDLIKNMLKHANFLAFVLDIYTDVEKAYTEYVEKERNSK